MPILITPEGERTEIHPQGARFSFAELYKLLGHGCDTIEFLWPRKHNHVMLVVDENGKLKKLTPNPAGTEFFGQLVVGNVVMFLRSEYNRLLRNHKDPKVPEYDKIPASK